MKLITMLEIKQLKDTVEQVHRAYGELGGGSNIQTYKRGDSVHKKVLDYQQTLCEYRRYLNMILDTPFCKENMFAFERISEIDKSMQYYLSKGKEWTEARLTE